MMSTDETLHGGYHEQPSIIIGVANH